MALTFVIGASNSGSGSSVSVTKPSAKWSDGNLLVGASVVIDSASPVPSGFSAIQTSSEEPSETCSRVAASEPSSRSFSLTGSGLISAAIVEYSGQDPTTPINASDLLVTEQDSGTSVTIDFPEITTTVDGCVILAVLAANIYGATSNPTVGTPSGPSSSFTSRVAQVQRPSSANGIWVWDLSQPAKGAITPGSISVSWSHSAEIDATAYTIAIAPAASGGGGGSSVLFRKSLSQIGGRVGSRQRISG